MTATAALHKFELKKPATGFGKSVAADLAPLYDRMTNHKIVQVMESGKATKKLIHGLGKEFLPVIRGTYRRMALRMQHIPPHDCDLQAALLTELQEEIWHTPMYYKWCKAVGMTLPRDFTNGPYVPETYAFVMFLTISSSDRSALEESCGRIIDDEFFDTPQEYSQVGSLLQTVAATGLALYGFPPASDRLGDAFVKHYGITKDQAEWWYEHGSVDMEHAKLGLDIIDRYATTPFLQRRAKEAAWLSLELWLRQWDAIYAKYGS
jgi:pyrroloquinoline quinone (PQQ) biosynthesis protein C